MGQYIPGNPAGRMGRVGRGRLKLGLGLVAIALVAALASACASGHLGEMRVWGYGPPPVIKGTNVPVPRAWHPQETPRDWNWIVIHHSASDSGGAVIFDEWHRKRGWDELGYDFVIDNGEGQPDGKVEVGSRWLKQKQGAHAKSPTGEYNDRGIGICLVGNFEKGNPTAAQWESLVRLVTYLSREYDISPDRIIGHHDVNKTTLCPGKNMDLERLRHDVAAF
jgi:hypothetical protein